MALNSTSQVASILTLENPEVRLTLRPDLGGRIDQLQDCQTGRQWLWHPAHYNDQQTDQQTRSLPIGASFDEHWSGGWDEIFPNDAPGSFQGYDLVDHGELWSQPWEVQRTSPLSLTLGYTCQTVPVRIQKTITLDPTQPTFQITYRLENRSDQTLPFLLKQHAAIAIEAGDQILLPDCLVEPVALGFSKIIGQATKTRFPHALSAGGQAVDLSNIPPQSSQLQEFYYCSELAQGECGIWNRRSHSALKLRFEPTDFPYVWVFQSYGGWQNHYVLVMEPCTTVPYDLEVAYQQQTTALLQPWEVQQRQLEVSLERSPAAVS